MPHTSLLWQRDYSYSYLSVCELSRAACVEESVVDFVISVVEVADGFGSGVVIVDVHRG